MICKTCHCRFAPFRKQDFKFVVIEDPLHGDYFHITAKNKKAEANRDKIFNSNDRGICGTCIQAKKDLHDNHVETLGDILRKHIHLHGDNYDQGIQKPI